MARPTKIFRIKADAEFMAEDIDDALRSLAIHFMSAADGLDSSLLIGGHIHIQPSEETSDEPVPLQPLSGMEVPE